MVLIFKPPIDILLDFFNRGIDLVAQSLPEELIESDLIESFYEAIRLKSDPLDLFMLNPVGFQKNLVDW